MADPRLTSITVRGYRSLLDVVVDLADVTVIQGANGAGKSNLYRALSLAAAAASGTLARTIATEGGMGSLLWAGTRGRGPRRVAVGVQWTDVRYTIELGLPQTVGVDPFPLDPEVKRELIELPSGTRWVTVAERANGSAMMRDEAGERVLFPFELWRGESMLSQIRDPRTFPVAAGVRDRLSDWRLYHEFPTSSDAPARSPQLGIRTPQLAVDGSDLAAAFATIDHVGDIENFQARVGEAFDGARVRHSVDPSGRFTLELDSGLSRPLTAAELSDGTLRFLYLLTALCSPRPASFVAVNEPETSLHPDLLPALARVLRDRTRDSQVLLTTHSEVLAGAVAGFPGVSVVGLERTAGATVVRR